MNELKSDLLLCLLIVILLPMPLSAANDDRPKLDLSGQWQAALDPYRLLTATSPRPLTVAALCHALLGTHSRPQLKNWTISRNISPCGPLKQYTRTIEHSIPPKSHQKR